MHVKDLFGLSLLALAAAGLWADERQTLSLVTAPSLSAAEVTASGRLVPQFSAGIGSRLAGRIVAWGQAEDGAPLEVGMAVKAGQLLFGVDPGTFKARADSAAAALASAQAARADLTAPTRQERLAVLEAAVSELDARVKDRERDEARFRQLVEVDRTMPTRRLEEVRLELETGRSNFRAAKARLDEAVTGPTPTEIAVADARVKEAQATLAAAQLDLHDTAVEAPFDGVITRRAKGVGDYVNGAPFVEVLGLVAVARLEAELRLPEAYLPQVIAGQTMVTLRSPLLAGNLEAVISRVVPEIDAQQGTFVVRVAIPAGKAERLVPGAFVTAQMKLPVPPGNVILPQRAVVVVDGKPGVMVASDGKMLYRPVELGDRLTEGVVVKAGVQPGERVVVGPAEDLKAGAALPAYLMPAQP